MRFVIASFLLLGLVFFELSGGTDFKPRQRVQTTEPAASGEVIAEARPTASNATARQIASVDTPELTRRAPTPAAAADRAPQPQETEQTVARLAGGLPFDTNVAEPSEAPAVMLVSLEQSATDFARPIGVLDQTIAAPDTAASDAAPSDATTRVADIRAISGSRVNMRRGPGTTFGIVTALTRGTEVEVLEESGDGWLRLRQVNGDAAGWMSADFVSDPIN